MFSGPAFRRKFERAGVVRFHEPSDVGPRRIGDGAALEIPVGPAGDLDVADLETGRERADLGRFDHGRFPSSGICSSGAAGDGVSGAAGCSMSAVLPIAAGISGGSPNMPRASPTVIIPAE